MKAIVAMARNRVIGNRGTIPWHLPQDLRFFKRTTLGHAVVMGRKTYDSIGRPLPGRQNFVLTSGPEIPEVTTLRTLDEVPRTLADGVEVFVIGGAILYAALLPECDELLVTQVDGEPEGDTFFPAFEEDFPISEEVERGEGYCIRRFLRGKDAGEI